MALFRRTREIKELDRLLGIAPNAYAKELVPVEFTTDCLFEEVS